MKHMLLVGILIMFVLLGLLPAIAAGDSNVTTDLAGGGGAVSNTSSASQGTGSALMGFRQYQPPKYYISALWNFGGASTISGTQHDFGNFILTPGTDGRGAYFEGWKSLPKSSYAIYGRLGFASGSFATSTSNSSTSEAVTVLDASVAFQVMGNPTVSSDNNSNSIQFGVRGGVALRTFADTFGQDSNFRKAVLGSSQSLYIGPEITLFANMNDVQPYVRISYFPATSHVQGLSDLQVTLGVTALATLWRLSSS